MKNLSLFRVWLILYCVLSCFLFNQAFATSHTAFSTQQQQTITGTVTYNNMPMTGVTITVKSKNTTVLSGEDGKFSVAANGTDTLIFEYLGFKTQIFAINNKTNLTIELEEDVNDLKEVTVNAGYYTVKETERTGSISKITAKDIEKQPVTNLLAAMQGRMAGVNITQNTGIAGGGFDIEIRGQNSLRSGGNNPLYVIDGVPYASDLIGSRVTSPEMPMPTSPLNSLNPGDIESIEVLRDADATAIYGSRGANGVVLVTTKKGKAGKTKFTANVSSGFGQVTRFRKLMDTQQYLQMRKEAFANEGITEYPSWATDINGAWPLDRDTDWQETLAGGNAGFTTVQGSVSGGSDNTQFLVSGNYSRETTVFPGDFRYTKANVLSTISHKSENKKFTLGFTAGYTARDNKQPSIDFMQEAVGLAPNAPALYDDDGNLNWQDNTFNNPLRYLQTEAGAKTYDLLANAQLGYSILENLQLRSSFGFTDLRHKETSALPSTMFAPSTGHTPSSSSLFATTANRQSWIIEPQLDYNIAIGKAKLQALAGATFQQQDASQMTQQFYGFASNALLYNPGSASRITTLSSGESVYKYQAFFGRVNFNFAQRYIVNLTGRRDGSSRFGPGNRFANFGAVGAAWVFSNEKLVSEKLPFLSMGKLRASYGTSGNDQIGDYQYLDTYSTSGYSYGVSGLQPTRLFNPDFAWESNKKLEAALELGFLNDRISTSVAWYRNRSSNQLVGIPLPGTTGFSELQANLDAEVENSGWEVTLRTVNIKTESFSWITSINYTTAKNKLLSFPDLESSSYANQLVIGQPLNIVKSYHYTGLDPQTGLYTFEDVNGDGRISEPEDKTAIKNLNPQYFGGVQNQFRYGNLQLDFLFQFVKQLNYNEYYGTAAPGNMMNQPASAVSHWQQAGDTGPYQVYATDLNDAAITTNSQFGSSDAAISDGSYIRLKNISLSYDLPVKWTRGISCRLSVQGQNMLTVTSFKGADPEFKSLGYLPPLKTITTSLQLTF
ncbi:SusC/RagA family TonB-linked outer membrane protein [Flavobacterium noncentrifugens]|uniref:TonB-linked outer membrane protein, SusC/RagA family n=1 Tax=Flavobacterium noncentrifugens TaxID=1128970 RepID=A0A1G8Y110_9FLAO|nr:SusC/RagA family TonB-linked outer membrane protein [Flavobacterium noncentrifugens]GEP52269.1 SusC/RagA family TonB-linked outer membrane protein [Flavobacterium noncentrifugens]SDJ96498.1 TonB-linked outer membrane protein, SusC/RagA family [Flavobacterium noncentrifugens]